eukprot:1358880-Lingulodinium_polyedra.AAC.1
MCIRDSVWARVGTALNVRHECNAWICMHASSILTPATDVVKPGVEMAEGQRNFVGRRSIEDDAAELAKAFSMLEPSQTAKSEAMQAP